METDNDCGIEIRFTPEFKRNLRALGKKYRHIRSDIEPVIEQIRTGKIIGDRIPKTGDYTIFKVRVQNSDIHKGKRSGYRMICYVKSEKEIILVTIYSKTEQGDITSKQIHQILKEYFGR